MDAFDRIISTEATARKNRGYPHMNVKVNEHVELHDLRGFVSDEQLLDALLEAQAIAKGTRCQQHLFSLSLNPPEDERVDVATFEAAIELAEPHHAGLR